MHVYSGIGKFFGSFGVLNAPRRLAVGPRGQVIVCCSWAPAQLFDAEGGFVCKFARQFDAAAFDNFGYLLTCDYDSVRVFAPNTNEELFAVPCDRPIDVCVDSDNRIFVLHHDPFNSRSTRVSVFVM